MKCDEFEQIAIVGTGMIAVSMAVLLTGHGYQTIVLARSDASVDRLLNDFHFYYQDLVNAGLMTQKQADRCSLYLTITQDYREIADADFVVESVYEQISVKHSVYKQIESACRPNTVIASMTSGISPDMLAEGLIDKSCLIVAHPFVPPHLVPCVEVVRSKFTSETTTDKTIRLFESLGREVIILNKVIEGFIVNRLQYAMLREAIHLIEQGVASAEDIDRTLLTSIGPRYSSIGLFEHMENGGLDLVAYIQKYLNPTLCNETSVQASLMEKVAAGNLGSRTGKGFLDWSKKDLEDLRLRRSQPYFKFFNWTLPD